MKIYNIITFFVACMLSLYTSAFVVKVSRWEKDGKKITVIGDVHGSPISPKKRPEVRDWDESHVFALTRYLSTKSDCKVLIEDRCKTALERDRYDTRFLPGLAHTLQNCGIKAYAVDFRENLPKVDSWNVAMLIEGKNLVASIFTRIAPHIPFMFQDSFEKLKNDFEQCSLIFTTIFDQYDVHAKQCWIDEVDFLRCQLFDFVLLAEINEKISSSDDIYVCAGASHTRVLEHILMKDGYTQIAVALSPGSVRQAQQIEYKGNLHCVPLDLEGALENMDNGVSKHTPLDIKPVVV